MESQSIALLDNATKLLAEVKTIDDAKNLMDMASAAKHYAHKHHLGKEAVKYASTIEIAAQIKLGEILLVTEKNKGAATPHNAVDHDDRVQPTLKEMGVSKDESAEAQALARLPEEVQEKVKSGKTSKKAATTKARQREVADKPKKALPVGVFDIIYADPPWQYEHAVSMSREIENQYPTMPLEEIKALAVPAADNAVLYLWATAPKVEEAIGVLNAWRFTYRTCAVWDKKVIGMGYWFRNQHELLLVGVKGKFSPPEAERRSPSVFSQKRGEHSQKPDLFYDLIEAWYPGRTYLELFARNNTRPNWTCWGNESSE